MDSPAVPTGVETPDAGKHAKGGRTNKQDRNEKRSCFAQWLRYLLRRKQCCLILVAQLLLCVLFTCLVVLLVYLARRHALTAHHDDEGGAAIDEHYKMVKEHARIGAISQYWSCHYKAPPAKASLYDLQLCHAADSSQPEAFAFYLQKSLTHGCPKRIHTTKCHVARQQYEMTNRATVLKLQADTGIIGCAGLHGTFVPPTLTMIRSGVLAPRITSLESITSLVIMSSELFVACPQCRVDTAFFELPHKSRDQRDICARRLQTIKKGWPETAKECDTLEKKFKNMAQEIFCVRKKHDHEEADEEKHGESGHNH